MNFKDTPIQRKLRRVILLTCGVVLGIMCSVYIVLEYLAFRQNLKSNVETLGAVIASNSTAALAFLSPNDATEILKALSIEKHIKSACLYDNNGRIFAKFPENYPDSEYPLVPEKNYSYRFENSNLIGFHPVHQKDKQLGTLFIRSDLEALYAQLWYYIVVGIFMIGISLFIAFLLSKILQKTISEPILALEQTARNISSGHDYSVRATKYGNDEVGRLTDTFNFMLMQIQNQNEEITRFNHRLEQKVAERTHALQQQKDFVETIINSSVDLIAVFDRDLRYMMINSRYDDLYSKRRDELIGKNILEVYPQTEKSGMYADLKRALTGETVHNVNYKSLVLNKSFENFYIPLKDNENSIYGVLTIGHDISNIMEANAQLEELNKELLKSNRDLEQFAYVASHDLQEPLRKIQTFTQLLGKSIKDEEKAMHFQQKISQSASRMQLLIQDVLNFSRISNSDDAYVETDLNLILENLKFDFELIIREKDAEIHHRKMPVIKGIPLQLSQMFSNLISNSLKYNDKRPLIHIECSELTHLELLSFPKLSNKNNYVKIVFKDNGIGFEPYFSEQIFKIFQRLHGKQAYSGTGIGLALCKKIVENHQGIIFASGEPGVGAEFTIILPGNVPNGLN